MTSKIIDRLEKTLVLLEELQREVTTTVERVDVADIMSDLKTGLEKLQALKAYQSDQNTDYKILWEERKEQIRIYQESRDAWVRTEIFTQILKSMTRT
jgi:hypothetical protein